MTKPVRLDHEAEEELDAAISWYQSQGKDNLGQEFVDAIRAALVKVGTIPLQFALRAPAIKATVRTCPVQRFPYSIIFLDLPAEVRIVAVAHMKRRPDYWRSRL